MGSCCLKFKTLSFSPLSVGLEFKRTDWELSSQTPMSGHIIRENAFIYAWLAYDYVQIFQAALDYFTDLSWLIPLGGNTIEGLCTPVISICTSTATT